MAQYEPTWSYGGSTLFNSSGSTVTDGDDIWSYGLDKLQHEFVATVGIALPIMDSNDIHSTIFGGQVIN